MVGKPASEGGSPQDIPKNKLLNFATSRRRLIPYFLGGIGVAMMAGGFFVEYINSSSSGSVVKQTAKVRQEIASVAGEAKVKMVKIDIEGAVEKPGVVEIPINSRIENVLISAGGLAAKADRIYISKKINLSQIAFDGMKIYIPFQGEVDASGPSINSGGTNQEPGRLVSLNSGTVAQLDSLPGVGLVTANKIISNRPYQNTMDLVTKKVVSRSVFEKIKDLVTVD